MRTTVPSPPKGSPLKASWAAAVADGINSLAAMAPAGMLFRDGVTGSGAQPIPENRRERRAVESLHPWKVYPLAQSEDVENSFEIYVPAGCVHVGEAELDVDGITAVTGSSSRYTLDCEDEISSETTLLLAVYRDTGSSSDSASDEEAESEWTAKIITDVEEIEDAEAVLAVLPIANVSVDSSGDYPVGKLSVQLLRSAVAFSECAASADGVSIDTVTDEDAEDPSALQVKDFDNSESDGSHGLAERLKVVKNGEDSFKIEAEDNESSVHLIARVNGRIKYIPIGGSESPDEDEDDPSAPEDPCDHDESGSEGGVSPEDENSNSSGGGGAAGLAGGVPADDSQPHTGDDDCNCE